MIWNISVAFVFIGRERILGIFRICPDAISASLSLIVLSIGPQPFDRVA
jgi:hypothetical protein